MTLRVNEIFYSLQGEGGRAGEPSIFIRLQGCSVRHACYASGVNCDTEFQSGREMSIEEIILEAFTLAPKCRWIIWTGGEPLDQLTAEIVSAFRAEGFQQAVETSGLRPIPDGMDYVCISPKVAEHVIMKHLKTRRDGLQVDELRFVRYVGQAIPETAIKARHYYLSPAFDGTTPNVTNINHCIQLCLSNPKWKLSCQYHKLINVR